MTSSKRSGSVNLRVDWTLAADADLESIVAYIAEDNPRAAAGMVMKIIQIVEDHLSQTPAMGRPGRVPKTRELIVPDTPYIVAYRIKDKNLEVLRVISITMPRLGEAYSDAIPPGDHNAEAWRGI
jgi:toxin ParE1/3/4